VKGASSVLGAEWSDLRTISGPDPTGLAPGVSSRDDSPGIADPLRGLVVPPERFASEPPEARGTGRDDVRLMVSVGGQDPIHARFADLPRFLRPGDLVVVNTSATRPSALDGTRPSGAPIVVHLATPLPGGLWLIELRTPHSGGATAPFADDVAGERIRIAGSGEVDVLTRQPGSQRFWVGVLRLPRDLDVDAYLGRHGRPIRYRYVSRDWPLSAYQTVFATDAGGAEMPSAARPFTSALVTQLVTRGVALAPLMLHAGLSSPEGHEPPAPERYGVPPATAHAVNAVRVHGGRVVAVGTTVVRALETVADEDGTVHAGHGWTDLVVTAERGVRVIDGLLTGWHEPEASHLQMLAAVAEPPALERAYRAALDAGYRWHEFGDSHLMLRR
jgi:S-adenosylmethionine:tRNA ribosyltransferase-isomerase